MIDRKITLGLILALIVESAGVFAWAGAAEERLREVELRIDTHTAMAERLVRVEVQLDLAVAQLTRIERKLETL
jgi:hypothetical protein